MCVCECFCVCGIYIFFSVERRAVWVAVGLNRHAEEHGLLRQGGQQWVPYRLGRTCFVFAGNGASRARFGIIVQLC